MRQKLMMNRPHMSGFATMTRLTMTMISPNNAIEYTHCSVTTLEFASEALRFEGPRKPDPA